MAQVHEFALPDLGEGLTEATVVRWLVSVGDVVAVDQPVAEVETAKAMVEVPCPYAGVVTSHAVQEGTELPVGSPLLTVASGDGAREAASAAASDPAGEDTPGTACGEATTQPASVPGPGEEAAPPSGETGSGNVLVGYGTQDSPRRRRRSARSTPGAGAGPGTPGAAPRKGAPAGGALTGPPAGTAADEPVPVISPLVRRLAREQGVDLRELTGSGPDGLIVRADVEQAAAHARSAAASSPASTAGPERIPLTGLRGATAAKLTRAHREVPAATCWVEADATELLAARQAINGGGRTPVSLLAVLARICVTALGHYPQLNSTVDTETDEVVQLPGVHLGFATQTDRGLVVPVLREAHTASTEALSTGIARLTESARAGSLTPADLTGGTFTLNNYGVFGVDGSTPLVNHPEAAMLGVGRIARKPWEHQGELALRQVVQLSLTFDHRVCDGGTAGGFLRYAADCVEAPALLLRTL